MSHFFGNTVCFTNGDLVKFRFTKKDNVSAVTYDICKLLPKSDTEKKATEVIKQNVIMFKESEPNYEIRSLSVKKLLDVNLLEMKFYIVLESYFTSTDIKVIRVFSLKNSSSKCKLNIQLELTVTVTVKKIVQVYLWDGPVVTWFDEDSVHCIQPCTKDVFPFFVKNILCATNSTYLASIDNVTCIISIFFISDMSTTSKLLAFRLRLTDSIANVERICIANKIDTSLYTATVTCSLILPKHICNHLINDFKIESLMQSNNSNDLEDFAYIICTKNQQCFLFFGKHILCVCPIESTCVRYITMYENYFPTYSLHFILHCSDETAFAIKYHQKKLKVVRCWNNISSITQGLLSDGLTRLILIPSDETSSCIIVTYIVEDVQCEVERKVDHASKQNIMSAVEAIRSKALQTQVQTNDLKKQILCKKAFHKRIVDQITKLKIASESNSPKQDVSLISLFNEKSDSSAYVPCERSSPSIKISKDSWNTISCNQSSLYARFDVESVSLCCCDDIKVVVVASEMSLTYRATILKNDSRTTSTKQHKFKVSRNSLMPGECGTVCVNLGVSEPLSSSVVLSVVLEWTCNDRTAQDGFDVTVNPSEIADLSETSPQNESLALNIRSLQSFQCRVDLLFQSVHTDLEDSYGILKSYVEFKFLCRETERMLVCRTRFNDSDAIFSLKICQSRNRTAHVRLYASPDDVAAVIDKLYASRNFPSDVIIRPIAEEYFDRNRTTLLYLKDELSYMLTTTTKPVRESILSAFDESGNRNQIIDETRHNFKSTSNAIKNSVVLTSEEYESFRSGLSKLEYNTDSSVDNLLRRP